MEYEINTCALIKLSVLVFLRGPTLAKIAYEISKSFGFIEIKMISSDFKNDFRITVFLVLRVVFLRCAIMRSAT